MLMVVLLVIIKNAVSNFQANPNLKPELVEEFELGVDAGLFEDAIGLTFIIFTKRNE